jgi:phosphatidylinositol 4-kinase B
MIFLVLSTFFTIVMASPARFSPTRKVEPESWLLRLFESDFFDSRLALTYLFRYPENVGIQHYICQELKAFPEEEIEFLLPQICHIIISRPNESAALEEFLFCRCKVSNHMAIYTLWYLESYLSDIQQQTNIQSEGFLLVKRLFQKCQTIIFSETHQDQDQKPEIDAIDVQKSAHTRAVMVGMGLLLAALGAPMANSLSETMVKVQLRQPRFYDPFDEEDDESTDDGKDTDSVDSIRKSRRIDRWKRNSLITRVAARIPTSSPTLDELSRGSAFSFQHYIKKTLIQSTDHQTSSSSLYGGYPSIDLSDRQSKSLDLSSQRSSVVSLTSDSNNLLNSHYFHSQIQFIMALVDISERLVSFPKHTRQHSLIAELTLINYNLPAKVCIPFWCPYTASNPHHHQIVRIALSDCVVLNSAERVPFLICVEVIDNGAENVRKLSTGSRTPSTAQIPQLSQQQSEHDVQYHQAVLSRRESAIKHHLHPEDDSEELPDPFSEKMRTAAVMLAQLYQQQVKETQTHQKKPSRFRSSTTSPYQPPKVNVDTHHTSFSSPPTPAGDIPPSKIRTDFELIRKRVLDEMAASEVERLASKQNIVHPVDELLSDVDQLQLLRDDEDPSASVFREPWTVKQKRIQESSPYGTHPNWQLYSVIVKSGADLRQEQLALQLIFEISRVWEHFQIPIRIYTFRILITSNQSGLIETIPDSLSIHSIKKQGYQRKLNQPGIMYTLYDHFIAVF